MTWRQKYQADAELSEALVERIKPILAGQHPGVVGAAIVQLNAIHLVSHRTTRVRHEQLLKLHADMVRLLLPVVEAELGLEEVKGGDND